jgi:Xaa-Pro dipeptidase
MIIGLEFAELVIGIYLEFGICYLVILFSLHHWMFLVECWILIVLKLSTYFRTTHQNRRPYMLPSVNHLNFLVPAKEIQHRIDALQAILQNMDVSAVFLDFITDLFYFTGSAQKGILLVPCSGKPVYFIKKSLSRAGAESPLVPEPYPGRKGIQKTLHSVLGPKGRLGVSLDVTAASTFQWLTSILDGCEITDISIALRMQRAVKSPWEQEQIRRASSQAGIIFPEMKNYLSAGKTELEVSASVEEHMRRLGHSGTLRIRSPGSDLGIVTLISGEASFYPTNFDGPGGGEGPYPSSPAGAGWKKIIENETVYVDMVTSYNGYFADHTRSFFMGNTVPAEVQKAHAFCLDVLALLEEKLVPGRIASEIYEEVHSWVLNHNPPEGFMGAGENKVKFFGHGIGVELDEFPIIAGKIDIEIQPGMVVAMEPKAFLNGFGPVGVENTYVVTEKANCRYCQTSMEITPLW